MFTGKLTKKNGKLVYSSSKDKLLYDLFIDKLKEGEEIEIFINVIGAKASTAQISKVHTCIRIIAMELGYSFEDMKLLVKEQAGLCTNSGNIIHVKSFAECSKEEMTLAIEACNCIAEDNGIILG